MNTVGISSTQQTHTRRAAVGLTYAFYDRPDVMPLSCRRRLLIGPSSGLRRPDAAQRRPRVGQ